MVLHPTTVESCQQYIVQELCIPLMLDVDLTQQTEMFTVSLTGI
jgi:hypothetical protein